MAAKKPITTTTLHENGVTIVSTDNRDGTYDMLVTSTENSVSAYLYEDQVQAIAAFMNKPVEM